jgi:tmRNA-binding protein
MDTLNKNLFKLEVMIAKEMKDHDCKSSFSKKKTEKYFSFSAQISNV